MRKMGLFDGIMKAFENEEYGSRPDAVKATARHILVDSEDEAILLMKKLNSGESSFEVLAKDFSDCPSASDGGSLVVGPIQTKFGYHLILVEKRSGGGDWY
ncbi:FKBP-like protein [Chaetoceros tenuissimus]|uniref:Peptidyl-prolyl cis-trans isomerase n=1 Tax=Chaetoceros tenuissimus TaxID=426638 RepID=A0AAD3CQ90_9STRA|nr:FKBP-like protein [Chaetoceros tenuissimus]